MNFATAMNYKSSPVGLTLLPVGGDAAPHSGDWMSGLKMPAGGGHRGQA
jgi:hypothetical protein